MSVLELRSAAAAYEGYFVPFAVDAATLRFLMEAVDLDSEASRSATVRR